MRDDQYPATVDPYTQTEQAEATQRRTMLLGLLRGRWHWAILLATLLAIAGGYLGFNSQEDMYSAKSFIEIPPDYSAETSVQIADLSLNEDYVNFVNDQVRMMKSLEVAESAMGQDVWQKHLEDRPDKLPEVTIQGFIDSIQVSEPGKTDQILYVSFDNEYPATASAGINGLLGAYKQKQIDIRDKSLAVDIRRQNDILIDLNEEKRILEGKIKDVIPNADVQSLRDRRTSLTIRLNEIEAQLILIEPALKRWEEMQKNATPASRREMMLNHPDRLALLEERAIREEEYRYLTEVINRGPEARDVKLVRAKMTLLDKRIAELEATLLEAPLVEGEPQLPADLAALKAQRNDMRAQTVELQIKIGEFANMLGLVEGHVADLNNVRVKIDEVRTKKKRFEQSRTFISEEEISRIKFNPQDAVTPTAPWNAGKRRQLAGVGAIGGFFVGFGLVMMVGLFDRRLRHVSDTAAGMPDANILGILPTLPADLTDPEDAETAAHCVHHIRTLLQIGGANRVFSITSPAAGSGKSSLSTALGMSFATSGARTLVIDSDLVGAGLSRRMGTVVHEPLDVVLRRHNMIDEAELARALTLATSTNRALDQTLLEENLLDQEQVEAAIRLQRDTALGLLDACVPNRLRSCVAATEIDNFFILPVGKARPSDASRLSPAAIRELIRQAREAFDIVLVDTGPVLGSLEASIAAAEADATILIVSRGDQKSLAARTLAQLRSVRANIAGIVFNHALDRDLDHTSYASVISQERRPERSVRKRRLDQTRSARLGPLGTAVASYTDDEHPVSSNGHLNGQDHDAE